MTEKRLQAAHTRKANCWRFVESSECVTPRGQSNKVRASIDVTTQSIELNFRSPNIADFRDWNHWRFCDWRCAPIPVRFFDFGWRNRLEGCGFWGGVCGRKDVSSSSAHEHPTSLGAAIAGAVEYGGDQCALQLAN